MFLLFLPLLIFQSTPSARRATPADSSPPVDTGISIHALREEGDLFPSLIPLSISIFQSTPSARRATFACSRLYLTKEFQSTPSARRATMAVTKEVSQVIISIHALREEGDCRIIIIGLRALNFNPRPPRGGRRFCSCCSCLCSYFNPRPPRGGRPNPYKLIFIFGKFQSTPSARRATAKIYNITP